MEVKSQELGHVLWSMLDLQLSYQHPITMKKVLAQILAEKWAYFII